MQLSPYLNFKGQCAEAFRFYEQCFRGRDLAMMTHGQAPTADGLPAEMADQILHAQLKVGDHVIMGSDVLAEHYREPKGIYVSINMTDSREAERIYDALREGGVVHFPIQKTFWADRFAMVVDRFRTPWMINCGTPGGHS